jgi:two-component system, NtrC family, response regulator AtoC
MARVLIVDDEKQIRRILGVMLQDLGHVVGEAGSGEEALGMESSFAPDIVLIDLSLPGIDGLETLARLLERNPARDCIMMTAYGSIRTAVEAMRLGAADYVTKPFDNEQLILSIDRALQVRRLNTEVEALRTELESRYGFSEIVGIGPRMQSVFRVMAKVAAVDATVLVTGESGTGKELVARAIHRRSRRARGPFVAVNCSAIPSGLVESEFFGHEKGAFTDARESRPGRFEQARGGTLFLDEIGDLSLDAQAKLLRALQEREVTRVGGTRPQKVDVRVIAATNRDLDRAVRQGSFREDLFWRINVVTLKLPPLRERREDLPLLIDHLLDRFNRELGLAVRSMSAEARALLLAYDWPGNVRELENTLCRAMILCEGQALTASDLPPRVRGERHAEDGSPASGLHRLELADAVKEATGRLEKMMILSRLAEFGGSRTLAAESLGVSRKTLFNKMRQYELAAGPEEREEGV